MTFIGFSFFNLNSYSTEKTDRSLWFIFFRHPLSCDPRKRCFVLVSATVFDVVTRLFPSWFPSRAIEMNCLFLRTFNSSFFYFLENQSSAWDISYETSLAEIDLMNLKISTELCTRCSVKSKFSKNPRSRIASQPPNRAKRDPVKLLGFVSYFVCSL